MKHLFSASKSNRLVNLESNKVVLVLGTWFSAGAPHHNIEAFISMGLIPVEQDGRFFLIVHLGKARRIRRLEEVKRVGEMFPLDSHGRLRLPTGI
jgi:hypothetical protein